MPVSYLIYWPFRHAITSNKYESQLLVGPNIAIRNSLLVAIVLSTALVSTLSIINSAVTQYSYILGLKIKS